MKPQLIMQDVGEHGRDLSRTNIRLLKGGSYKKQRIVYVIPAIEPIYPKVYLSHVSLMMPPNQAVVRIMAQGFEVGDAYSQTIEQVLNHPELSGWEYLLTIEHDNVPPSDGVMQLLAQMEAHKEFACIGGLYFTKGEGGIAQIWGDPKDPVLNYRPQVPVPEQLVECNGTGMGFNLFRLAMFKDARLRRPWFETKANHTQDLYFWSDARKYGYRCAIDCAVKVGHYDSTTDTVW